ncbi:MAG: hypothetical protein KAH31_06960 [Candidatus Sabulitectum sp.]|nr:hypothetical protein [Candidatus Sabulitectum sp.]
MKFGFICMLFAVAVSAGGLEPEVLWNASFPGCVGSVIWNASEDYSGGYVAVGEVCSGVSGEIALNICRVDSDGLVIWENTALNLGNASAYSIERTTDGFVLCGVCSDSSGKHGLVMKIDSDGNTVWTTMIDHGNDDVLYDLCSGTDGRITAVGYSLNDQTHDNDILAACLSDSGQVLWQKTFVYPEYQTAHSIVFSADSSQGFVITGSDNSDVFLMKIDNEGNWLWKSNHFMEGMQSGSDVALLSEGGYIVAGSTRGSSSYSDALLVFFDWEGKVTNEFVWGTDGPDNASAIQEILPAGFVVVVNSNEGTGEGYRPYIFRFDPWLSIIWSVAVSNRDAFCYSLAQTLDGGFIITGKKSTEEGTGYSSCVVRLSGEDLLNLN